ncbi:MAG: SH3 domain-containing C40 family peptidase [Eubacteriales bacterium]
MKNKIVTALIAGFIFTTISVVPTYAAESINDMVPSIGVSIVLEETKTEEEYIEAAKSSPTYGYTNIGIAKVDNHLNIRETADTSADLVGKMSNGSACEVLSIDGDWAHITSGEVEGYVHMDYLFTGTEAKVMAEELVDSMAYATSGGLRVRAEANTDSEILTTMAEGEGLEVIQNLGDWIEVSLDSETGYISAEYASINRQLPTAVTMTELLYGAGVSDVRVELCQYAQEFIGNPYVWGGTSLTNGADCSGFVLSVFKKYGISLPHSSSAQSKMGTQVSLADALPGDLVFYTSGGSVNHVALYIGNGQVVHASNPSTGIRVSDVSYRSVYTVRRFIND